MDDNGGQQLASVVVPFFNNVHHIAECIEGLLGQERVGGPFEIILVDNGSSDGSRAIADRYKEVVVLEQRLPGAYAARNTGIESATAPVLAFTDADCVAQSDWLCTILQHLQDPTLAILVGHCRYPSRASWALHALGAYENAKASYVINQRPPAYHFAYANNMAVRSSVFDELGLFKEWKRAGDSELVHRLATRRPDLGFQFCQSMRVVHMEFVKAKERAQRLSLYTQTNAKIDTFCELNAVQRLGLVGHLLRRQLGKQP